VAQEEEQVTGTLVITGLVLAALLYAVLAVHGILRKICKALNPAWLWFTGLPLDGHSRTNASWLRPSRGPRPVLHNSGHAVWWHHMPRLHRAGVRSGATAVTAVTLYGLAVATWLTVAVLCAVAAVLILVGGWQCVYAVRNWRHERHYVKPLERTLADAIGAPPVSIEIERAGDEVKQVAIEWAPDTELGATQKQAAIDAVTTRLALEAPDDAWKLKGRNRSVVFTQSEPPPSAVSWDDVKAAVMAAAFNELVFGTGKRAATVKAAYSESPHLCIPGGSGGGKSNLAASLLLQEMLRGSLIFNLDPKWISHLWLQNLPNVINAHDIPDLHLALAWLGRELLRRTKAAYYSAGGTGRVRGNVGSRIIVLCEELNYGMPGLKDYWRETRSKEDAKQSPAIAALSALSCAGRASDIHEWLIAQMLTVASTGVSDSTIRTNAGIKAMARWDPPGWNMAVGKHVTMPPQTTIPGRIHVVTGDGVRETQVPYLHLDDKDEAVAEEAVRWARDLAVSGTVALIPSDVPEQLWPASVLGRERPSITAGERPETRPSVPDSPPPPVLLTLPEAYATGMFGEREYEAVRKAVQRARLEPAGKRGTAHEYEIDDLHALASK
jgi:hypothetical protein